MPVKARGWSVSIRCAKAGCSDWPLSNLWHSGSSSRNAQYKKRMAASGPPCPANQCSIRACITSAAIAKVNTRHSSNGVIARTATVFPTASSSSSASNTRERSNDRRRAADGRSAGAPWQVRDDRVEHG
jgi:hypothetical protein